MGGTDDPSNLMEVSVEEHSELHLTLYLNHGCWEDWLAYRGLAGIIGREEIVREQQSRAGIKGNTGRKRPDLAAYNKGEGRKHTGGGWNKGIPRTEEEKKLMSERRKGKGGVKGKVISEEHREKIRKANTGRTPWNKGKPRSEETKAKIRATIAAKKLNRPDK